MTTIDHAALYCTDLERTRLFYETFFDGVAGDRYHNPRTGLQTYFLTFSGGARLEVMVRPELTENLLKASTVGWSHVAFSVKSIGAVDQLTTRLQDAGFSIVSGPRTTGDGYYESCVLDPDGNLVEITV
ncbi:VOC family protein [Microbacterium sp. K24]|uniref:VOC family protein n=1 Tax=Microbacterium sp. K24 TaxID=2305446 RepID=UPI00109CE827|nr:VOC family protein [Microbacterium sp. K24]